jgi:hypothetical protein
MNRDYTKFAAENFPSLVPQYTEYNSDSNIRLISEEVTKIVKERVPFKPPIKVSTDSIKNAMWQIYENARHHPQVMIQMVINALANQVILEEELQETNDSFDPWIQSNPENFGISSHNLTNIKLNNRRGEMIQFTNIR